MQLYDLPDLSISTGIVPLVTGNSNIGCQLLYPGWIGLMHRFSLNSAIIHSLLSVPIFHQNLSQRTCVLAKLLTLYIGRFQVALLKQLCTVYIINC
jgi:hypothetical protein